MARDRFKEKSRMFTEVKGLRMLWATPAASLPTMAHLPDCSRCSWLRSNSLWAWSTFSMRLCTRRLRALTSSGPGASRLAGAVSRAKRRMGPRICLIRM